VNISIDALSGIPDGLRKPLIEEYKKLTKNFREGRWEPAELNGGRFSEIVYTILRGHVDGQFAAAPAKPENMWRDCLALEKETAFPRAVRIQIPRMLMALYEIRNNRNVGHVGADVNPNHMDASAVLALARWVLGELVRIFHGISTEDATRLVDQLTDRTIPLLWNVGTVTRVLNGALSARDKALVLLYGATDGLKTREILDSIEYANGTQFRTKVLKAAHSASLLHYNAKADHVTLSPLGARYVEENIKLEI
jgi:hypothetical protein